MNKCGPGCNPICDFCSEYYFTSDDGGIYVGDGFCKLLKVNKEPNDGCEDFKCFIKKIDKRSEIRNTICNYCEYYNFNPGVIGQYVDNGFCKLHEVKKDPSDTCKDFSGC
jgi:hypothetical protein